MCVTFCHRRNVLFWNHENCSSSVCEFAKGPHGRCASCVHNQGQNCALTNAPLPDNAGCCHWNISLAVGRQIVTLAMVEPLGLNNADSLEADLIRLDTPLHRLTEGIAVDPDELGLPTNVYGQGTEPTERYQPTGPVDLSGFAWED